MSGDFDEESISFSYFLLFYTVDNLISVQVQGYYILSFYILSQDHKNQGLHPLW